MSAHDLQRPVPRTEGRVLLVRFGGLLTSVLAAVGLVLLPPAAGGAQAHADTGNGSAVTKSGTKGAYDDFSKLKVTVEQTKDLRTQGLKVSWTGGAPTQPSSQSPFGTNYLQIMQCWGDASTGPTPQQCEFGNPPPKSGVLNGTREVGSHDPQEPTARTVPFTTVKGQTSTDVNQFFTQYATNEQVATTTGADGTGETIFQVEDATQSPILGCGAVAHTGQAPAPCWLVVVPRGTREPDGSTTSLGLLTSALSAGNWAQRMVFRLDFQPTDSPCPIGQAEQPTIGSEMVGEAMSQWQPTLCTADKTTFSYVPQLEDFSRTQVLSGSSGLAGLAFVENPVVPPPDTAAVVHAPVAVSGLVIGYNIQVNGTSRQVPRIRLNARLVAKMLTQSYQCDLPGNTLPRGALPAKNPDSVWNDPEFLKLNEGAGFTRSASCGFGFGVPQSGSDSAEQLWKWLRSDPDAENFLAGKADPWGMTINPSFLRLDPAHTPLSDFQKPDPTAWVPNSEYPNVQITAIGLNPYAASFSDEARTLRKANNGGVAGFAVGSIPPSPTKADTQIPGQYFNLGLTDAASAARYRLGTAELLNADGQFVAPTVDALTKAVDGMKAGQVPGVVNADPSRKTPGAYPLTTVTYAAASTSLDPTQRKTYATLIRYAAGAGQQTGIGYGLLPPGYAPLTPALRDQALASAAALEEGRVPPPTTTGGTSSGGSGTGGTSGTAGTSGGGGTGTGGLAVGGTSTSGGGTAPGGGTGTTGGGTTTGGSPSASPSSSAAAAAGATKGSTGGPSASPPVSNVAQTGGRTPGAVLGAVRWVLLIVLIAGIAGSLAGPLLMRAGTIRGTGRALIPFGGRRAT
ncbi:hypothetical protein [Actinacidiphila acididurans]|uniref:PBP domain-containing protein n=1 Tax=Actinacidiphila acididurans TaxID=2784346 RepID=A0ABS2TQ18_9ACTN|nr:hypothetical protein [Actinacidiphila acididurans]MBM9504611.1 hypothetical protein [Actinacidiphila acididurans]